jgi:hypothetical protein
MCPLVPFGSVTFVLISGHMPQYKFFPGPSKRGCRRCLEVTQSHGAIGLSQGPCHPSAVQSIYQLGVCHYEDSVWKACDNLAHGSQFAFCLSLTLPGKRTCGHTLAKWCWVKGAPTLLQIFPSALLVTELETRPVCQQVSQPRLCKPRAGHVMWSEQRRLPERSIKQLRPRHRVESVATGGSRWKGAREVLI